MRTYVNIDLPSDDDLKGTGFASIEDAAQRMWHVIYDTIADEFTGDEANSLIVVVTRSDDTAYYDIESWRSAS
jgi:hypothetical protein